MIPITHIRTRWTSAKGVEFVPVDYKKYPASQGWTDIRHFEVDLNQYDMDIPMSPGKTLAGFARDEKAEIVINASYESGGKALGHIVKKGKLVNDTVGAAAWINFIVRNGKASIEQLDPKNLTGIDLALTSTPQIVRDGKIFVNTWGEQSPANVQATIKRARTGASIKADGKLLFAIVDGDSPNYDAGMRLDELAALMIKLGARQAMAFDGGGSSAVGRNGDIISGNKGLRQLGSCVSFTPKNPLNPMRYFESYNRISSPFGPRIHPKTGKPHFHSGIDYVKAHKGPVYAVVEGTVQHAKNGVSGSGFGNMGIVVAIEHKDGALACYMHLDSVSVKVGDFVKVGQEIGKQGATGPYVTGSHLHFEVRKKSKPSFGWESNDNYFYEPLSYLDSYFVKETKPTPIDTELEGLIAEMKSLIVKGENYMKGVK